MYTYNIIIHVITNIHTYNYEYLYYIVDSERLIPIPIKAFPQHTRELHMNRDLGFEEEYKVIQLSIYLSIYLPIYLSIYLCIYLFIYLS